MLERRSLDGFQFHPDIIFAGHPDAREGRDERAFLDRDAAEGERPDIPPAAELFWRIIPALLISKPGDRGIQPGKGPLVGLPGKRDKVGPVREHLPHAVETR